jgi:outer membrane protein assembly factor BamB
VDAATGAVRWSVAWGRNADDQPALPAAANRLLFAADGNSLVAHDATNGRRVWRSPRIAAATFDDPIVTDGMVYAMATDGAVHAYRLG